MNKQSKVEAKKKIQEFFTDIENKSPKEIKKIKRLAMSHNIILGNLRKKFCKKCLNPYSSKEKIKINKGIKSTTCENCGFISRWEINSS